MTKRVIQSNLSKLSARRQAAARKLPKAVEAGFAEIAQESIGLYEKTTRTWKHKPRFYPARTARGVTINTDSQIYKWVDEGTKAHVIKAKRAPFLVFQYPYRAATKPRVIASYNAQRGPNWARKFQVNHPGTKPRKFTDEITKRMQKRAANIMRKHINEAINVEAVGL